jgi:hypothetical protein
MKKPMTMIYCHCVDLQLGTEKWAAVICLMLNHHAGGLKDELVICVDLVAGVSKRTKQFDSAIEGLVPCPHSSFEVCQFVTVARILIRS